MRTRSDKISWWMVPFMVVWSGWLLYVALSTAYDLVNSVVTGYQLRQAAAAADGVITGHTRARRPTTVVYRFTAPDAEGRMRSYNKRQFLGGTVTQKFPRNTLIRVAYVPGNPERSTIAGLPLWPSFGHVLGTLVMIPLISALGCFTMRLAVDTMRGWFPPRWEQGP